MLWRDVTVVRKIYFFDFLENKFRWCVFQVSGISYSGTKNIYPLLMPVQMHAVSFASHTSTSPQINIAHLLYHHWQPPWSLAAQYAGSFMYDLHLLLSHVKPGPIYGWPGLHNNRHIRHNAYHLPIISRIFIFKNFVAHRILGTTASCNQLGNN